MVCCLPQGVIPGVDGVPANNLGSVWDSGLGVLVTWQPFDFGLRARQCRDCHGRARTGAGRGESHALRRLRGDRGRVSHRDCRAADGQAARAAVDSWQVLLRSIHAQVAAQLRPGADESRVQAELALAQTQVAQAEQAIDVARATLAQFVGSIRRRLNLNPARLASSCPRSGRSHHLNAAANPLAVEQNAADRAAQAQLNALERTYYPQFAVQGLAAARGTGMETDWLAARRT